MRNNEINVIGLYRVPLMVDIMMCRQFSVTVSCSSNGYVLLFNVAHSFQHYICRSHIATYNIHFWTEKCLIGSDIMNWRKKIYYILNRTTILENRLCNIIFFVALNEQRVLLKRLQLVILLARIINFLECENVNCKEEKSCCSFVFLIKSI